MEEVWRKELWRDRMRKFRYIFYSCLIALLLIPIFPLPFSKPRLLHDLFSGAIGELIEFSVALTLTLCWLATLCWFAYRWIRDQKARKSILTELIFMPLVLFTILGATGYFKGHYPDSYVIYALNKDRTPEDFINPFLGYSMTDCRNITNEFDVVFVPSRIGIEVEYMAYAPRREKKTIDYKYGIKYGDDWYWEFSGSQWSNELRNCVWKSESPN